jgi:hypothetical protein
MYDLSHVLISFPEGVSYFLYGSALDHNPFICASCIAKIIDVHHMHGLLVEVGSCQLFA